MKPPSLLGGSSLLLGLIALILVFMLGSVLVSGSNLIDIKTAAEKAVEELETLRTEELRAIEQFLSERG